MKKFLIGLLCVAGVAYLLGVGVLVLRSSQETSPVQALGDVNGIPFTVPSIASSTTVGSTSKLIMATSTDAQWRLIQNVSSFSVFLSFASSTTAANNTGVMLLASSSLELKGESMYQGPIAAISPNGTATLLMSQK